MTAPLAVLDVSEYYAPDSGGVRTYLHEKGRYAAAHPPVRQVVVVPGPRYEAGLLNGMPMYQVPAPRIPFQSSYRLLLRGDLLARIVAAERPSIIEAGSAYGVPWHAVRAARRAGIPVVWFYHAHLPQILAPFPWLRAAASRYVRAIAGRMDRVLVASESVRRDLAALGVENTALTPLGVDTATFHPGRRERRSETLGTLELPDGPLVLYTGRFTREKELASAVRSWVRVRTPGATLVLAGTGPRESELRDLAGPGIRFLPFQQDRAVMADLCAAADLYLAPGPAETFGLSAHEAMACGTPVLSVDRGAVADTVRAAGIGGCWVHGDGAMMAAEADRLLGVAAAERDAARRYIESHHRWDIAFDRIFSVYADVIAGTPA